MSLRPVLLTLAALTLSSVACADEPDPVEVGEKAPDFEITGVDGETFKLSDRIGDGERNVVLLFSRAHW